MRKIFFAIATITLVSFYSCESKKTVQETKETTEKKSVNQDTLSAQKTVVATNGYTVLQDNGQEKTVTLDHDETIVALTNFPVKAQDFIKQNFSNSDIYYSIKEVDRSETKYKTQLKDGTKIEFDVNGDWKEVKNGMNKPIPTKFFPENISKYIQTNYPKIDVNKIEKDAKDKEIKVELIQNNLDLKFDLNGNFIKLG
ncbi:PepSY-like domain-containing protein [Algoriella sp.]|uniref:PepSY-like domain-containing protein n=1 Tax=Algoriella sp. TaxID=1872434 RepID=UPI002FC9E8F4